MQAELVLGTLRSVNVNTPDGQFKIKTIPTDNWLVSHVVYITHEIEIDGQLRTELLVFPDSVERHMPVHEISTLVKMGIDTGKVTGGIVIHVIPDTSVTLKSGSIERHTKQPRQAFQSARMHVNNPYLMDFLKGLRSEDGSLVALDDAA